LPALQLAERLVAGQGGQVCRIRDAVVDLRAQILVALDTAGELGRAPVERRAAVAETALAMHRPGLENDSLSWPPGPTQMSPSIRGRAR